MMLSLLLALHACGGDEPLPTDSCRGPVWRQCDYNEQTQQFDRNCRIYKASDAGVTFCDGGAARR